MRISPKLTSYCLLLWVTLLNPSNSDTLDNAFELEIEETTVEFEGKEEETLEDLTALETEDWKEAPKFLKACADFGIEKGSPVHRYRG